MSRPLGFAPEPGTEFPVASEAQHDGRRTGDDEGDSGQVDWKPNGCNKSEVLKQMNLEPQAYIYIYIHMDIYIPHPLIPKMPHPTSHIKVVVEVSRAVSHKCQASIADAKTGQTSNT